MTALELRELLTVVKGQVALDHTTGCLDWTGPVHPVGGHGVIYFGGQKHRVARLVAAMKYGPRLLDQPELYVHHVCGNPQCCRADHLEVMSPRAHTKLHSLARGVWQGASNPNAKHSPATVRRVRKLAGAGVAMKTIAAKLGLPLRTTYYLAGEGWRAVA